MAFTLKQVVPWGRSFDEYRLMFSLDDTDLDVHILGCGDGPASFNVQATSRGASVVSCDPLYRFDTGPIRERIHATREEILEQTRKNLHQFRWDVFGSVEGLAAVRSQAMEEFLGDLAGGRAQGRYIEGELPDLPFGDRSFDLALCSHLLFLYSEQLSLEFHLESIEELCRVASEVRVFPLVALHGAVSPHLEPVLQYAADLGFDAVIENVSYEFQRGANQMMRLTRRRGLPYMSGSIAAP